MSYIEREALLKSVESRRLIFEESTPVDEAIAEQVSVFEEAIENAPTTDVVEVVRCKDCKWWTKRKDRTMSRDKQINELAKTIYSMLRSDAMSRAMASMLYGEGYRKTTDVAREIFEEIEKYNRKPLPECEPVYIIKASEFAELKKKYTEEGK